LGFFFCRLGFFFRFSYDDLLRWGCKHEDGGSLALANEERK